MTRQYEAEGVVVTPSGAVVLAEILRHERGERGPVHTDEIHPATLNRLIGTALVVDTSPRLGLELTGLGWRVAYAGQDAQ